MKKRLCSIILLCSMALTLLPTEALAFFVSGKDHADDSYTGDIPVTYEDGSTGTLEYDETWEEKYPYGAFVFGTNEAAASEDPADGGNTVTIPVYRLGGTEGRATVYIHYQPMVSQDGEESLTYAYAASGRDDMTIQVEDPQPVAQYQPLGAPKIYAGCGIDVAQGVTKIVDENTGEEIWIEEDYQLLSLALDDGVQAEDFTWQAQVMKLDENEELYISQSWTTIPDALDEEIEVPNEIWYADDAIYDFRCFYTVDGKTYCTATALEVPFEETTEELPDMPPDIELNAEPTYSTLNFKEEYDACDFELTFAHGEWVKNIIITVKDDSTAELPEMGLFTMTDNAGGEILQVAATMTMLINDNDPFEPSELGFTVSEVEADQDDGSVTVTVQRTGGLSYPVSVSYEAVSGTAQAGKQFAGVSGTLMFAGDVDSIDIKIPLIAEEARSEPLEFTVVLSEIQGGGQDDLCSLAEDTVTVKLTSSGKAVGLEAGLNLASVLATASGEDISASGVFSGSLLPEPVTITGTQQIGADTIVGTYVESGNGRTYTYASGLQFRRNNISNYSDNYWMDWENAVGWVNGPGNSTVKYWLQFSVPDYTESTATVPTGDTLEKFEQTQTNILMEHNNTSIEGSRLVIADAGMLFSRAEWSFRVPQLGIARAGRKSEDYLYVMPYAIVGRLNMSSRTYWDGNVGKITDGDFTDWEYSWDHSEDLAIDYGALETQMALALNKNEEHSATGWEVIGTDDELKGANGTTRMKLTRMSLQRRAFTNTQTLGLKIHTANDADSGLSELYAQLDESLGVYTEMKPQISLVATESGVDSSGNLYVGSKLLIDLVNTKSYFALVGKDYKYSVYLTDADGNVKDCTVEPASDNSYYLTMKWAGMTTEDLSKAYTINVVMERQQTVTLDISNSLPDGASSEQIAAMWAKATKNGTREITYGYSQTVTTSAGLESSPKHYTHKTDGVARVYEATGTSSLICYGSGDSISTTFRNLQYINFNMDSDDIILFNGRSYAGNENIYLNIADLALGSLVFQYCNSETLTLEKTMQVTILQTALYYDGNGNGRIDGYYNSEIGYFVLDESAGDKLLGFIEGEFDEKTFQPVVDADGTVHQYFLKAYYTMTPRSLQAPAGASTDDTAMVIPVLMSSITNTKALGELSTQQQSYRYLQAGDSRQSVSGAYTDSSLGKPMYGAEVTATNYVDIPLGGDKSPLTYTVETTQDGVQTKVYSWTPDYCGKLLVDYADPDPIYNEKNITGESIAIAGEEPHWEKTAGSTGRGILTLSAAGKAKVNGYLASLVGDTVFALAVQEEPDQPISKLDEIDPESITIGNVKALPNGDYLSNMEGTGSPDTASGGTDGASAMPEFESDLGVTLPSTNFGLSDYASIIMDGYAVGFSIGLPIIAADSYNDPNGGSTPPGLQERVKDANSGMSTLKDFISSVAKRDGVNAFKDIINKDYNEALSKKSVKSKDFAVSFSVALAILFEYNPIDNTYYFKSASIAATAGLQFTMQYRFTFVPLLYIYLKSGFEVGLTTGLSVERTAKEGNRIVTNDWLYDVSDITTKGLGTTLDAGESACFIVDISNVRGFRLYMDGSVFMEVLTSDQVENYKKDPNGFSGSYIASGRLSSDGSEPAEIYLPDGNYRAYVVLTALETTDINYAMEVSGAKSLVYWNGINFSPSGFIEVGAGVGIELLKFELYLKAQMGLSFTIGGYSEDAGSYQGAQLNNFDLALSLGFNVTVLFFNYSMDLIGYYLHIEDTGAERKVESKWGALDQTFSGGKSADDGGSIVSVSAPTDTSDTQRVAGVGSATRAYNPTDDNAHFQLSGYGTSGDGFKLMEGLATGNSYKVFRVGDDNYILYTQSRKAENAVDIPQLVLSRVELDGGDSGARLQSPSGTGNCLPVDNDAAGDLDYSYSVDGSVLTVIWSSYSEASGADEKVSTVDAAKRTVVKTASIDLSASSAAFTTPTVISDAETETFRFLPQQEGGVSIYAESAPASETANTQLAAYLKAVYGLTDAELESGETTDYNLAAALYRWNYQNDLNEMYGSCSKLTAYTGSGTPDTVTLSVGELIENLETTVIDGTVYAAYSTVQYAYFDKGGNTVALPDEDTDLAAIKRLYLRSYSSTSGWGSAKLLQTVIDFDRCTNNETFAMSDGIYSVGILAEAQGDPYISNLKFLRANLSGSTETVLLYEMGGNTYIINESGLADAAAGMGFTASPIFAQTEGMDAVISSDSEGNLAVVYTAPMTASGSNALYVAWWDENLGEWGSGNVLAMNHLQVYEDSVKYGLLAEQLEKAYLGQKTGNKEYDAYIDGLTGDALESAAGNMEQLTFSNLQITLVSTTSESGAASSEQLLVLAEGSLQELTETSVYNPASKETITTVIPKGDPSVGFYAISFGAGRQGVGQANLSLTDYDFTAGSKLSGTLTFTNTGTAAIRASSAQPAVVTLTAADAANTQTIAEWTITESVRAGSTVELPFIMDSPLTMDLVDGMVFSAYITEDVSYASASGGEAFAATTGALLTVDSRPELQYESFSAQLIGVSGDKAVVQLDMLVSNRGGEAANNVFVQLSYEASSDANEQYLPINISGSGIEVDEEELIQGRGVTGDAYETGVIYVKSLSPGHQSRVHGTLMVPLSCFRQDDMSGLHLRAEIFSDADNFSMNGNLYTSTHAGEYSGANNVRTEELAQETFFSAPKRISTAIGNTLLLPVSYASTSASGAEIVVREISDGTDNWTPSLGILYYENGVIVAAPAADTAEKTGIIQLEDLATNSIFAITYRITDLGSGINIFKDDESFTFYEADGSKTDLSLKNQDWVFNDTAPSWSGGTAGSEMPMNGDTVHAKTRGAYLTFNTVADTITLWFDGEVTVSSSLASASDVTAKSSELRKTGKYPLTVDFGNDNGETHTVTIKAAAAGLTLDRYTATYAENTDPVQTDESAPQIYWSRSFPDTASLQNGTSVTLTCYVVDDGKLVQVTGIPASTSITKTSEGFWSFPLTITENGLVPIRATDSSGKTTTYSLRVDWFNSQVSEGAIGTAPSFPEDEVELQLLNGSPVTGPLDENEYPYIKSTHVLQSGETITARRSGEAAMNAEQDGRWKVMENGIYLVRVTAADGTWSQVVLPVDVIDDGTFTISVQHDEAARRITVTAGGGHELTELTVNGYSILSSCAFTYTLGGEYAIFAKNTEGRTVTSSITVSVPMTIDDSAVKTEICSLYGRTDGKLSLELAGIHGGSYDASVSQTANNSYQVNYSAALIAVDGELAELDTAAAAQAKWTEADNGVFLYENLASGWYQLLVRSSSGDMIFKNVFVNTAPPVASYEVIVTDVLHGVVTAEPRYVKKGHRVTITATPDSGYTLQSLTVTDRSGMSPLLTLQPDGSYTFAMSDSDVTVTAVFASESFFTDVPENAYYYDAVKWAIENGITAGVTDTLFVPDGVCTRAQIVTFLWRAAGCPAPDNSSMPFTDVAADSYYYDAVLWAVENGITAGVTETLFAPDDMCIRAQAVTFLWRAAGKPAPAGQTASFSDIVPGSYYYDAVLWAVENGITAGTSGTTFSPGLDCTRAQIITLLYRSYNK